MALPARTGSKIPEVRYSGRFLRADDRRRDVVLTLSMVFVWLLGFAVWIALWRYGRWLSGPEGQLIRFVAFCGGGFHVVSMGLIRAWIDRNLYRFGM